MYKINSEKNTISTHNKRINEKDFERRNKEEFELVKKDHVTLKPIKVEPVRSKTPAIIGRRIMEISPMQEKISRPMDKINPRERK